MTVIALSGKIERVVARVGGASSHDQSRQAGNLKDVFHAYHTNYSLGQSVRQVPVL